MIQQQGTDRQAGRPDAPSHGDAGVSEGGPRLRAGGLQVAQSVLLVGQLQVGAGALARRERPAAEGGPDGRREGLPRRHGQHRGPGGCSRGRGGGAGGRGEEEEGGGGRRRQETGQVKQHVFLVVCSGSF